jgi:hypothetical protein
MQKRWVKVLVVAAPLSSGVAFAVAAAREDGDTRPSTLPTFSAATAVPPPPAATRAVDPGGRVLDSVDLNRVPLRDAIERLRSQAGVNLFVSWNVLARAGVNPDTPVDAKLSNVPLGRVLDLILSDAAGGDGKLAWAVEDGVIRVSTAADLERSAMLRRERKEWADGLRAQGRIDEQIPSLHLDRMPLWQAIDTVSAKSGLKINVPWQTLQEVGVGRSAPISVDLDRPTTSSALTAILDAASERGVPLGFALRGDTVEVATRATLRRMTDMRVYDVSALIAPDAPAAPDAPVAPAPPGEAANRDKTKGGTTVFRNADEVAQWIKETVDPESWRDNRGGFGSLRVLHGRYAGLIAVTQTDDNHREISRVLNALRELRPPGERTAEASSPIAPPASAPSR